MTYEEKKAVVDELVERFTYDVPEEYHIDTSYFYTYFDEYVNA